MRIVLAGLFVVLLAGVLVWTYMTRPQFSSVERGRRLAEEYGCFTCHGPNGTDGAFNPGRNDATVPNWRGDLMMYANDSSQIRQWIQNGVTDSRAQSQTWRDQKAKGALKMPAYDARLNSSQIGDLVKFVMLVNGQLRPEDSLPQYGYTRADSLGCFGCHGSGGWLSHPNPGSLKGYVASWASPDFDDLVGDRAEFDEWVTSGVSARMKGNFLAHYFLRRSVLHMPAYEKHLRQGDLDAIWAYIQWLRSRR